MIQWIGKTTNFLLQNHHTKGTHQECHSTGTSWENSQKKRKTTADIIPQNIINTDQQHNTLEEQNIKSPTATTANDSDNSNNSSRSESSQASQDSPQKQNSTGWQKQTKNYNHKENSNEKSNQPNNSKGNSRKHKETITKEQNHDNTFDNSKSTTNTNPALRTNMGRKFVVRYDLKINVPPSNNAKMILEQTLQGVVTKLKEADPNYYSPLTM